MKASLKIVFVAFVIIFGLSATRQTDARLRGVAASITPMAGAVNVTISCPGTLKGTAAHIAATRGECVSQCRGTGGTATFDGSGNAATTLTTSCTGGSAPLVGCEFTAFWEDKNGVIVRVKATVTPMAGHAGDFKLVFKC